MADETPVKIIYPPRIVLHIVPLSSFAFNGPNFDAATLYNDSWPKLGPMGTMGCSARVNFDGLLVWTPAGGTSAPAYVQVFRNGIIESVTCAPFLLKGQPAGSKPGSLASEQFEKDIIEALPGYFAYLERINVEPPYIIIMSLHGVLNYGLSTDNPIFFAQSMDPHNIERNDLLIPEIMLESVDGIDVATIMKPLFDSIWNAASWPFSLNYDKYGKWVGVSRRR